MNSNRIICDTSAPIQTTASDFETIRSSASSLAHAASWTSGVGGGLSSSQPDCDTSRAESSATNQSETGQRQTVTSPSNCPVHAQIGLRIPTVYLIREDPSSPSFHVYQLSLRNLKTGEQWSVYRRYSQFYNLYKQLKHKDPNIAKLRFPPKRRLNNKASTIVQERRIRLEEYMRALNRYILSVSPSEWQANYDSIYSDFPLDREQFYSASESRLSGDSGEMMAVVPAATATAVTEIGKAGPTVSSSPSESGSSSADGGQSCFMAATCSRLIESSVESDRRTATEEDEAPPTQAADTERETDDKQRAIRNLFYEFIVVDENKRAAANRFDAFVNATANCNLTDDATPASASSDSVSTAAAS